MPIKMVDLKAEYLSMKEEIDQAIQSILNSGQFIGGEPVEQFAREFAKYNKVKHVIPCGNGTDALLIALMAMECKSGDEIIVPSFTYISTVSVIVQLGLTPKFIDVDPRTFNLDPNLLEPLLTSRTRGIMPVHIYGQCADMEPIT